MAPASRVLLREELRALFPGLRIPPVVALAAYFDESKSRNTGIVSMAGYVGETDMWDGELSPEWNDIIARAPHKISEFKASDCNSGKGEFDEPWTPEERKDLTTSLISTIIRPRRLILGIGASVHVDFNQFESKKVRKQVERMAVLWAFLLVVRATLTVAKDWLKGDRVQIIYDEERHMQERMRKMFVIGRELYASEWLNQVRSPYPAPSHEVAPLQAADLLAFETYKATENWLAGFPRPPRRSFVALLEGATHVAHFLELSDIHDFENRKKRDLPPDGLTFRRLYDSRSTERPGSEPSVY